MISSKKVLVLSRSWRALGVVGLQKAMGLLFSEYEDGEPKARIVTPPPIGSYEVWSWSDWSRLRPSEGEEGLVAVKSIYKVPEVLLLSRYDGAPKREIHFCRRAIWKRDNFTCQYCGRRPDNDELTIDHIVPKSLGGETSWTNCVLACYQCNSQKADRTPANAFKSKGRRWVGPSPMRLLREPKKPEYMLLDERMKILDTWRHWITRLYWEIPLDNDMDEDSEITDSL